MLSLSSLKKHTTFLAVVGLVVVLVLSGCSQLGGGQEEATPRPTERPDNPEEVVNVVPTPLPSEDVGGQALSGAKESFQETWNNYLRDVIAEQVADRAQKIQLLERYENPAITEQNLGGLLSDIDLVEDRTQFNVTNASTVASANTDFDVRVTYLNGDSDTRTCQFFVSLEQDQGDSLWYVINPAPLQVFANCFP